MSFDQLQATIDANQYKTLRTALRQRGWITAAEELEVDQPVLGFAPHAGSVGIVPPQYVEGLSKGAVLLETSWALGLSPRPSDVDETGQLSHLRFVPSPLTGYATRPPSLDTLVRAAKLLDDPLELGYPGVAIPAREVVARVESKDPPGISVQVHPHLIEQKAVLELPARVCFTEIVDSLAAALDAEWDWIGDRALVAPRCTDQAGKQPGGP